MSDPKNPGDRPAPDASMSDLHAAVFEIKPNGFERLAACGPVHIIRPDRSNLKNLDVTDFYGQLEGVGASNDPLCARGTPNTYSESTAPKHALANKVEPEGASGLGGPIRTVITGPRWEGP